CSLRNSPRPSRCPTRYSDTAVLPTGPSEPPLCDEPARRAYRALIPRQQRRELVGHAEHWVMAGVELIPSGVQLVGRAFLMCFARIDRAAAPDHRGTPLLIPEPIELDGALVDSDRMQRVAIKRPSPRCRIKVGE